MSERRGVAFVLGTRPEIIKLSPLLKECERRGVEYTFVHTGQHYDEELDEVFFEQLELPRPEYNLSVGSASHGRQTGEMLCRLEPVLEVESPAIVLVQGDTNSVLAGAITTSKLDSDLGHVEAGLRSYQEDMAEEINRRVADHVSDQLYAPTSHAVDTLRGEGIPEDRIYNTGNTVVDAVHRNLNIATDRSTIMSDLGLSDGAFAVLTAHRAENVDDAEAFRRLLTGVDRFATETGLRVIYPIHPHPTAKLSEFDLSVPDSIRVIEPVDYLDFLVLQDRAAVVFTDSGGVQEECCILGVSCVTLRDSTERPETVDVGANVLAGTDPERIRGSGLQMRDSDGDWPNPFGDGTSAERILDIIDDEYRV